LRNLDEVFSIELLPEEADVRVGGASYLLMRREAYCLLYKELSSTLGRGAEAILFRAGHERAKEFYEDVPRVLDSDSPEDVVRAAKFLASRLGLYRVHSFDLDPSSGRAELVVDRSFEVCEPTTHERPRCHYIRGFWAGLIEEIFGGDVTIVGREEECQGMGNSHCRFVFSPMPE
jgi:predicted hydrocarbon binding protein